MVALAETIVLALFPSARSKTTTPSTAFFARTDLLLFQSRYPDVVGLHSGHFVSMFTHGDLTLWNVMVRKGKIAAIIDWECSGWRPDYWEYTKAQYNPNGTPQQWFDTLRRATGEHDEHLKGERCLWVMHEFPASPAEYPL